MGETCSQVAAPQAPWVPCMLQAPWPPWSKWFWGAESGSGINRCPKIVQQKLRKSYGLWWFIMVYDGLLWFMMVYYGLWWFIMVYYGYSDPPTFQFMVDCTPSPKHRNQGPALRQTWAGLVGPKCCHFRSFTRNPQSAKAREVRNGAGLGSSTMANSYFRKVGGHNRATSEPILL